MKIPIPARLDDDAQGTSMICSMQATAIWVLFVAGCGGVSEVSELENFIEAVQATQQVREDRPPVFGKPQAFTYRPDGRRSPFQPSSAWAAHDRGDTAAVVPDLDRSRRYLRHSPLDRLEMVGTLTRGDARFGLVRGGAGAVHRVAPGDLLGEEGARVQSIEPLAIQLVEALPDGAGAPVVRSRTISLENPLTEATEDRER